MPHSLKKRTAFEKAGRFARRLISQQRSAAILAYHRISCVESDPQQLCVSPDHFVQHLEVICRNFQPINLSALLNSDSTMNLSKRGVVLTFDDGYADNLYYLKPLLERYEVPATVFVTTGNMDSGCEFWWDQIESLLLCGEKAPEIFELRVRGKNYQWPLASQEERQKAYSDLHSHLLMCQPEEIEAALSDIRRWRRCDMTLHPSCRPLKAAEVRQLAEDGLVEIGAHTVSHGNLLVQSTERRLEEITKSKADLEKILRNPIVSFSYPFGWTDDSICQIVKDAGFEIACTVGGCPVRDDSDVYRLGRLIVRDWDGQTFVQELESFLAS